MLIWNMLSRSEYTNVYVQTLKQSIDICEYYVPATTLASYIYTIVSNAA